ncbi:hypothetical protein TI05_11275 [Achromatium sp. WMS3]|nr:hypothetical protein TI05_11275 [Achromatium sp. WMS3]
MTIKRFYYPIFGNTLAGIAIKEGGNPVLFNNARFMMVNKAVFLSIQTVQDRSKTVKSLVMLMQG